MEIWTSRNTSSNSGKMTLDFFLSYGPYGQWVTKQVRKFNIVGSIFYPQWFSEV